MEVAAASTAIEEWAVATVDDLGGTYDYAPDSKDQPLPDLAVEIVEERDGVQASEFPRLAALDQVSFETFYFDLLLVHAPEPPRDASVWLANAAGLLKRAARADVTLGNRVNRAIWQRTSYRPAFVRFDDASQGRAVTLRLALAEEV